MVVACQLFTAARQPPYLLQLLKVALSVYPCSILVRVVMSGWVGDQAKCLMIES